MVYSLIAFAVPAVLPDVVDALFVISAHSRKSIPSFMKNVVPVVGKLTDEPTDSLGN